MAIVAVLFFVVGCSSVANAAIGSSEHRNLLYPHMANNGDTELSSGDDVYDRVNTFCKYHLYGTGSRQLYVGSNGFVTFPNGQTQYVPMNMCDAPPSSFKMIAPLWSDNYPPAPNAIGDHIWYREEKNNQTLLDRARDDIRGAFNNQCDTCSFEPTCLFIVTWQRQESYCDNIDCCWGPAAGGKRDTGIPIKNADLTPRAHGANHTTNYYQMVWATDDHDTFAMFNFLEINWWNCYGDYARSGFFDYNNGNPKCAELTDSGTANVNNLEFDTNAGKDGRWIYRTDKALIKDENCNNFVQQGPP